jgi:hypothetical protein
MFHAHLIQGCQTRNVVLSGRHAKLGEGVDHRFRQPVNDCTSPGSSVSQKRKPALLPILTAGAGRFLLAD